MICGATQDVGSGNCAIANAEASEDASHACLSPLVCRMAVPHLFQSLGDRGLLVGSLAWSGLPNGIYAEGVFLNPSLD